MSSKKDLFLEKKKEVESLGGLYSSSELVSQLEMSFPNFRRMFHQAADNNDLEKIVNLIASLETNNKEL